MRIVFLNEKKLPVSEQSFSEREISIGREDDNLLQLLVGGVSRYHGKISFSPKIRQWQIVDLNSTNGILLNGKKIDGNAALNEADIISIGVEKLQVFDLEEPAKIRQVNVDNTEEILLKPNPILVTEVINMEDDATEKSTSTPHGERTEKLQLPLNDDLEEFKIRSFSDLLTQTPDKKSESGNSSNRKSLISNKLYYTFLICSVMVILAFFVKFVLDKEAKSVPGQLNAPESTENQQSRELDDLMIYYVKQNISSDNVFRFTILLENKNATFTVDDLQSQLSCGPISKKINDVELMRLIQDIKNSEIMTSSPENTVKNSNPKEYRELNILLGGKTAKIKIADAAIPREFLDVEESLKTLSDSCGMAMVSLSPEELLQQAENSFKIAEDKFANYESDLSNLKIAIAEYTVVADYLKAHSPEPGIRKIAVKKLKQAEDLRSKYYKSFYSEYITLKSKKDFAGAKKVLLNMMDLLAIDSKSYNQVKVELIFIDNQLRRLGMKGRK